MPLSLAVPAAMILDCRPIGHCSGDSMRTYQTPVVRKAEGLATVTAGAKLISGNIKKTG
jgi:hypothetical protein